MKYFALLLLPFLLAGCVDTGQRPQQPPAPLEPPQLDRANLCTYPNASIGGRCCLDIDLNGECDDQAQQAGGNNGAAPSLSQGGRNCENAAGWVVGKWENQSQRVNVTFTDGRSYIMYQGNDMYYGSYSISFGDFRDLDKYTVLHLGGGPKPIYYACLVGEEVQLELTDETGQRLPLLSRKAS